MPHAEQIVVTKRKASGSRPLPVQAGSWLTCAWLADQHKYLRAFGSCRRAQLTEGLCPLIMNLACCC